MTEPLDTGWEKSAINVPSPGTIASYRKGRYHVHETKDSWNVHLDNHDPKLHPLLHLIDDAPLLLMIGDTFVTLIAGTRKKEGDTREILEGQKRAWQQQAILGIVVMLVGIFIFTSPLEFFTGIFTFLLPLAIIIMGLLMTYQGVKSRDWEAIARGIAVIVVGIVASMLGVDFWAMIVLLVLGFWMIASAVMLFARGVKGKSAIPEGFYSRLAIAVVSLALVIMMVIAPDQVLILLMAIIGVVAFLLGLMLLVNGLRLRERMHQA